jgi:hypothetical protein
MPLADVAELKPDVFTQKYAGTTLLHSLRIADLLRSCASNQQNSSAKPSWKASQETRTPFGFRARRNPHRPKSNRMPDAPHSVKVVGQVVDGI